jgi:Electron transfer DM13
MSQRKLIIGLIVLIIVVGAWYAFRPERLFINQRVNEQFPSTASAASNKPVALAAGQFHSVAHETKGSATIYQLPDGKKTVRLTNFETSNGPDVNVYLVAAADATDSETVIRTGFLPLGSLKGNIGDQNYDLPADVDLSKYRAVTIWCRRFGVNFGTAPLKSSSVVSGQ